MKLLPLAALMAAHLPTSTLASDTLLVSGFSSNSVTRYDAARGAFLGELGPESLQGVLGLTLGPDGVVRALAGRAPLEYALLGVARQPMCSVTAVVI